MPEIIYFAPGTNPVALFESFYHKWNRRFLKLVLTEVPHFDPEITKEICQQTWTEIWQGIVEKRFEYLTPGLLVYRAISRIKDHYRRSGRFSRLDPTQHDKAQKMNIDANIDYKTALASIPEGERTVFSLFFRDGLTQIEIAERLEISTRTVRRRIGRALEHLRGILCAESNSLPC
jgi:RNA polymerase sigma factor (sigma-70 family)